MPPVGRACRVAVIGTGVAGLASARALLAQGLEAVVFEKSSRVGGTWVYDPRVESDTLGLNPEREVVHGSIYKSLRTNLPRQLMGFPDFPFPEPSRCYGDPRVFPSHREVLALLEDYARESRVEDAVRLGVEVVRVAQDPCRRDIGWVVESKSSRFGSISAKAETTLDRFDAVVVCSRHHTQPRIAEIPDCCN